MILDLEDDERRHMWLWEHIQNSEDVTVLASRGHDYQTDNYKTGQFAQIVKHLQRVAPDILWRITFTGSDEDGVDPSQWRVICVPEGQYTEAQEVFDRFLDGENLDDYCYTDKYPEIYEKLPGKESRLNDMIVVMRKSMVDYIDILDTETELPQFVEKMALTLPQMYLSASKLPYLAQAGEEVKERHVGRQKLCALSTNDPFLRAYDPFTNDPGNVNLLELLASIRSDIEQEVIALTFDDPDEIAAAVSSLRRTFLEKHGWGYDLLQALFEIHIAKARVAEERRRQRSRP